MSTFTKDKPLKPDVVKVTKRMYRKFFCGDSIKWFGDDLGIGIEFITYDLCKEKNSVQFGFSSLKPFH